MYKCPRCKTEWEYKFYICPKCGHKFYEKGNGIIPANIKSFIGICD